MQLSIRIGQGFAQEDYPLPVNTTTQTTGETPTNTLRTPAAFHTSGKLSQPKWHAVTGEHAWYCDIEVPVIPAQHIVVPSFSMLFADYRFQFTWLCPEEYALQPVPAPAQLIAEKKSTQNTRVSTHIDCWHSEDHIATSRIRLVVYCASEPSNFLLTLSARALEMETKDLKINFNTTVHSAQNHISQMQAAKEIRSRICNPTSLAMALSHVPNPPEWTETVRACYDPITKAYGSWPLAILWASKHNILGAIETFTDTQKIATVLANNMPIVCSIRFNKDELSHAPLKQTAGHLVMLRGLNERFADVYDPAAHDHVDVPQQYDSAEFLQAWLQRRGAGYIFCARQHLPN